MDRRDVPFQVYIVSAKIIVVHYRDMSDLRQVREDSREFRREPQCRDPLWPVLGFFRVFQKSANSSPTSYLSAAAMFESVYGGGNLATVRIKLVRRVGRHRGALSSPPPSLIKSRTLRCTTITSFLFEKSVKMKRERGLVPGYCAPRGSRPATWFVLRCHCPAHM